MIQEASGVVLAGGKSKRFGSTKALAPWNGKRLVEAVVESLVPLFPSVLVLVKDPAEYSFLGNSQIKVMADLFKDVHPLGGIYSALTHTGSDWVFICGCDMPFIRPELVRALWSARAGYQTVVPVWEGRPQTLCSFYSQAAKYEIGCALERKEFSVHSALDSLSVKFLGEDFIRRADPEGQSFRDIDTRQDYEQARKI